MSSSVGSGVLTLLHTACGAGILAMPYAFKPFGILLGCGMIAFCGACSLAGLMIQGRVSKYAAERNASFFALAQITYPQLSVIFDLAIAVKCFGVGVSYMVVVGDLMPHIFATFTSHGLLLSRNLHITLVMLFVVSPLCFMKRLDSLRYASMVAISSVAYLCVLVLVHFAWPSDEIRELKGHVSLGKPVGSFAALLSCFPIFVFAYTCHHNMFSIVNELRDNSLKGIYKVSVTSVALAMSLYLLIGGSGYATFGDNVAGNIITLYPQSPATTIGRVAIALLVMLAFPLQCHPARASVDHILHFFGVGKSHGVATPASSESSQLISSCDSEEIAVEEGGPRQLALMPLEGKRFVAITASILLLSYLLAISVTSLARVLAVVGATGSTSISFILPGIFGYQLIGSEDQPGQSSTKTKFLKYLSLVLACWGMIVLVTCLSATLLLGTTH